MKLSLDPNSAAFAIRSYGPGRVVVNDQTLTRSLVVMPEELLRDWPPQTLEELAPAHFAALAVYPLQVLLLGTGARLRFPPRALFRPLEERGIGVEVMDTGAACRTYAVLMSEGRQVAAALLMI